ncbi:hypothetical protein Bca4012_099594 [Brassica carinata]|uniref:BnaC06g15530D protein n=2 Tax=Brassica napus TaxID=3708 RepID=A0A078F2C0_BRANA|nr:hypothetical protein HID58_071220 [Brassica napus]CAF2058729.1 unnamed protein product [Brassica napus]CDY07511.1 BnaC06g15530D [Brassica napus]
MLMVENWGNEFAWCNFLLLQLINHKTYVKSRLKCDWNRWRQQATLGRTDNQCSFFQITSHLRNENITDVDDHLHDISKDWLYPEVSTVYRLHTIRYDKRKNSSMQQFRMALSYDPLCWETYGGICSLVYVNVTDLYNFFDILPLPYQVSLRNPSTVFGNVASQLLRKLWFHKE